MQSPHQSWAKSTLILAGSRHWRFNSAFFSYCSVGCWGPPPPSNKAQLQRGDYFSILIKVSLRSGWIFCRSRKFSSRILILEKNYPNSPFCRSYFTSYISSFCQALSDFRVTSKNLISWLVYTCFAQREITHVLPFELGSFLITLFFSPE